MDAACFVISEGCIGKIFIWRIQPSPSHRNPKKPCGSAVTIAAERDALIFKISKREMLAINGAFVPNAMICLATKCNFFLFLGFPFFASLFCIEYFCSFYSAFCKFIIDVLNRPVF